jgi:hypothetical protein
MDKTFTLEEIELAILKCPKHEVEIITPDWIDGDVDSTIETIEAEFLLYHLTKE